jgi:hypothetical protein
MAVFFTGALMIVSVFVQLYVMSKFATNGDVIGDLETKKAELIRDNKKLNEEISKFRNIKSLAEKSKDLGFVDINPKEVGYIRIQN